MANILESSYNGSTYKLIACTGTKPRRINFSSHAEMEREFDRVNNQIEKYIRNGQELVRVKGNARNWFVWNETRQVRMSSHKTEKSAIEAFDNL